MAQKKKKGRKPKVSPQLYISNPEFYQEIIDYFEVLKEDDDAPIPECLWIKFEKLTKRIAMMPKFSGYTYKEELMGNALVLCAEKIRKFKPEKSKNPFSFFTQVIQNCYWATIFGEKREAAKKKDLLELYEEDSREEDLQFKYESSYDENGVLNLNTPGDFSDEVLKKNTKPVRPIHDGGPKYGF